MSMKATVPMNRLFDQNLRQRTVTALIAAPLAIALIVFSWWTTTLMLLILLALGIREYIDIVQKQPSSKINNILFGVAYLALPLVLAIWLRRFEPDGLKYFMLVLIINWTTDSFALFGGKLYGKHQFAPVISPKKTWEGVIIGVVSGVIITFIMAVLFDLPIDRLMVLLAVIIPPATVIGDLLESKLKRRFGVKDSGTLFPGHGGVLDRVDSPLFCLPIAALLVMILG